VLRGQAADQALIGAPTLNWICSSAFNELRQLAGVSRLQLGLERFCMHASCNDAMAHALHSCCVAECDECVLASSKLLPLLVSQGLEGAQRALGAGAVRNVPQSLSDLS
jgi:hypothetical protein